MEDVKVELKPKRDKNFFLIEALDLVRIVLICFVCVFICTQFLFKPVRVEGESMYPTLENDEYGFSNIFGALMSDFNRFDVVVVNGEKTEGDNWVKRIIGLPNETVEFKDDVLYIDGKEVKQPFLDTTYMESVKSMKNTNFTDDFGPITLGENEYFVMGDNRRVSFDSRAVGPFLKEDIISKSVLVLYPLDKIGLVNNGTK